MCTYIYPDFCVCLGNVSVKEVIALFNIWVSVYIDIDDNSDT